MTTTLFVTAEFERTTCAADAVAMVRVWRTRPLQHRWEVWSVGVAAMGHAGSNVVPSVFLRPLLLLEAGTAPLHVQALHQARLVTSRRCVPKAHRDMIV